MSNSKYRKLSPVQIKYFANLLTLKTPKWQQDSWNNTLITAKVDAIPHQVEAAQFAFRNPFSGGVILGDEVGLGKTIETGLILSQYWAEGKRKFLIIAPKSLRHQWQDELKNLFYIDAEIIDTTSYKKVEKGLYPDPLIETEKVLITNEHFVAKYQTKILDSGWDIVVIDEAHKLRNVWKSGKNQAKRAKAIREAIQPFRKLLLTATPMQNNLMELFGLCSFIDPYALGTAESFKKNFVGIGEDEYEEKLTELKYRMQKFFKRELRKNILSFISYTNRNAVTIPFDPDDDEEELRIKFEEYLQNPETLALPPKANGFLRLVYFKLLASSSFALKNSLCNLYIKLIYWSIALDDEKLYNDFIEKITRALTLDNGNSSPELLYFEKILFNNITERTFEGLKADNGNRDNINKLLESEDSKDCYDDADLESEDITLVDEKTRREHLIEEGDLILHLISLSRRIRENSKGKALTHALDLQFDKAKENGWPEKAVIFTEFKTTQKYIIRVLEDYGLDSTEDIVVFNGDSGSAEERRRLIQDFSEKKKIFLTTEAGAEGLNLQFCNLLINYDLPWNPQRIEQRIGRCHRYGQKLDVVVVNFSNRKNIADQRILELLDSKFKLFEGAFGASNTVLGQIESGTDIEKEILNIYLTCRNKEEIDQRFDELLSETSDFRDRKFEEAKQIIENDFDEEVQKKLKKLDDKIKSQISESEALVRDIVLSSISTGIEYTEETFSIKNKHDFLEKDEPYSFHIKNENSKFIGPQHSIIQWLSTEESNCSKIQFMYTGNHNISMLEKYVGMSGRFVIFKTTIKGVDVKEILYPTFILKNGDVLLLEESRKLLGVRCNEDTSAINFDIEPFSTQVKEWIKIDQEELEEYNEHLYNEEIEKVDCYFDDLQELKNREIAEVEKEMSKLKADRRKLKLEEARKINLQITKLKKVIILKGDEITQLHRDNAVKEKERVVELNEKSELMVESGVILTGKFEVI